MSGRRQKNRPEQEVLAFAAESRSDAPTAAVQGTETLVSKRKSESLAGTEQLMEEVCELETASRHYNESRPTKGIREWTG
jgi:RNA-directed DNA polymerase